jgi:predicted RNase H-like HicB family nuclease
MSLHVHEEVLAAANRIGVQRGDWTFTPYEVVRALPGLKENSVRTDIVSRCCVNAPKNHLRKWDYFRRVGYGQYEVLPKYRTTGLSTGSPAGGPSVARTSSRRENPDHSSLRDVIHAVIHAGQDAFTAECLEVAAVTQGSTLDEVVRNLNEVLALFLEGEDLVALGLSDHLRVQVIFEAPLSL